MNELFDYFSGVLVQLYEDGQIPEDLYQYGLYTLGLVIPIVVYAFCLGCTYKFLTSIFDWGGKR